MRDVDGANKHGSTTAATTPATIPATLPATFDATYAATFDATNAATSAATSAATLDATYDATSAASSTDTRAAITEVPIGNGLFNFLGAGGDSTNWGRGVTVAVLDTGVAPDPTFLPGQLRALDVGWGTTPGTGPEYGHGTAVAALAAGNASGAQGIANAAGILSIRVTDEAGLSDIFTLSQGILAAVDAGAQVINISLGGYDTNSVLTSAIGRATAAGSASMLPVWTLIASPSFRCGSAMQNTPPAPTLTAIGSLAWATTAASSRSAPDVNCG
jgi:hypothetical protein